MHIHISSIPYFQEHQAYNKVHEIKAACDYKYIFNMIIKTEI